MVPGLGLREPTDLRDVLGVVLAIKLLTVCGIGHAFTYSTTLPYP